MYVFYFKLNIQYSEDLFLLLKTNNESLNRVKNEKFMLINLKTNMYDMKLVLQIFRMDKWFH